MTSKAGDSLRSLMSFLYETPRRSTLAPFIFFFPPFKSSSALLTTRSGAMRFTFENRPHPQNPRTSHLAALSAVEALRQAGDPAVRVGT